jgi:hypothetical protein
LIRAAASTLTFGCIERSPLVRVMGCKHCEGATNGEPSELGAGFAAYQQGDYTTAFQLLLPHAEAGNVTAERLLGSMHQLDSVCPVVASKL